MAEPKQNEKEVTVDSRNIKHRSASLSVSKFLDEINSSTPVFDLDLDSQNSEQKTYMNSQMLDQLEKRIQKFKEKGANSIQQFFCIAL